MSSSSNATFQYGFVQFGQPDYNLLLGIMFILVALGLIVVFTVKEAQSHHAKEVTPAAPTATVKEAPTVAPTSAAKPKKAAAKATPAKKQEPVEVEEEEVEEKNLSTPKKRSVSTRRRKSDDAMGFITSPEGTRASARLATKTPGK